MVEIGLAEAEQHMGELLARAIQGEQIAIMQSGHTIVRIVPGDGQKPEEQREAEDAISRIEARSASLAGSFCWNELKVDRNSGLR